MDDYNPYERLPRVETFQVTSADVRDGEKFEPAHASGIMGAGGGDVSPQLAWSGFPEGTRSFCVTMYDPDAPTASGFWHWAVANIPAGVTELPRGAGRGDEALPRGAFHVPNEARMARYIGAAPPPGHGRHRYFIVVHAVDVPTLDIDRQSTPGSLGFQLFFHTLGRATIVPWYEAS